MQPRAAFSMARPVSCHCQMAAAAASGCSLPVRAACLRRAHVREGPAVATGHPEGPRPAQAPEPEAASAARQLELRQPIPPRLGLPVSGGRPKPRGLRVRLAAARQGRAVLHAAGRSHRTRHAIPSSVSSDGALRRFFSLCVRLGFYTKKMILTFYSREASWCCRPCRQWRLFCFFANPPTRGSTCPG